MNSQSVVEETELQAHMSESSADCLASLTLPTQPSTSWHCTISHTHRNYIGTRCL